MLNLPDVNGVWFWILWCEVYEAFPASQHLHVVWNLKRQEQSLQYLHKKNIFCRSQFYFYNLCKMTWIRTVFRSRVCFGNRLRKQRSSVLTAVFRIRNRTDPYMSMRIQEEKKPSKCTDSLGEYRTGRIKVWILL